MTTELRRIMLHNPVVLNLDKDEAIVLFELLSRWSEDQQPLQTLDQSETLALERLHGKLQSILVAPLQPDYKLQLELARSVLRQRSGTK